MHASLRFFGWALFAGCGLFPSAHDATVPPAPALPDERKLRILYSVDFWLAALAVVLVALAWLRLFPWFGRCVYGITC